MKKLGQKLFLPLVLFLTATAVWADVIIVPKEKVEKEFTPICNIMTNVADYNSVQVIYSRNGPFSVEEDKKIVDVKENECLPIVALDGNMPYYDFIIDGNKLSEHARSSMELYSYIDHYGNIKTKPEIINYFRIAPKKGGKDYEYQGAGWLAFQELSFYDQNPIRQSHELPESRYGNIEHLGKWQKNEVCYKIINADLYENMLLKTTNYTADIKCPDKPETSAVPCKIEIRTIQEYHKIEPNECIQKYALKNSFYTDYEIANHFIRDLFLYGDDYSFGTSPENIIRYFNIEPSGYVLENIDKEKVEIEKTQKEIDHYLPLYNSVQADRVKYGEQIKNLERKIKNSKNRQTGFFILLLSFGILGFILLANNKKANK